MARMKQSPINVTQARNPKPSRPAILHALSCRRIEAFTIRARKI
jgi:hypothetical protein